ncbi:hypothetical protein IJ103_00360 [Candidatus Saccharibacteria bacterium]|nr:hypothetical protein [Candidatus Saccharibacteria bacterium]MBQ9016685.1 hypothetical protein [Candidatus Saccharibacteria bacterium]
MERLNSGDFIIPSKVVDEEISDEAEENKSPIDDLEFYKKEKSYNSSNNSLEGEMRGSEFIKKQTKKLGQATIKAFNLLNRATA